MPVRIENEACYIIRGDGQRAAVELNLERLPGFEPSQSIVTGAVLVRLLEEGWRVHETRTTPYDGLLEAILAHGEAPPEEDEEEEEHEREEEEEEVVRAIDEPVDVVRVAKKKPKAAPEAVAEPVAEKPKGPQAHMISWGVGADVKKKHVELIERVLVSALKQDVFVYRDDDKADEAVLKAKGGFSVIFNKMTPPTDYPVCSIKSCFVQPKTMWKISVENIVEPANRQGIMPWLDGVPVLTDEGNEVASVSQDRLYVYFAGTATGNENMLKALERLYQTALEAREHPEKFVRDTGLAVYKRLCVERLQRETEAVEKATYSASEMIKTLRKQLIERQTEMQLLTRQLESLGSAKAEDQTRYEDEFKAMTERFDDVTEVKVIGTTVYVTTKEITCVDPRKDGQEHLLGRFRIVIDFGAMKVRMFNLDRICLGFDSGMQAPHVFTYGKPCWGTLETVMTDLLIRMDVPTIVQTATAFLRSVNVDDPAGRHISDWPVKGSGKKAKDEKPPNVRTIPAERM